ncbi:MAG TPA: murein biosynthesis integral membrane protein MurJ [Bacteriovoracaceae bacterium]|nr:murein biosynthesis integral membrane protein MurJ [Bacteriovoracaceae bacterium]
MSIFKSSLKMAIATFFSRILGLIREQVMAAYFGASGVTDAFLVAYRIPNLLRDLFAEGAFSSAFVPTFVETNHESKEKSNELMWSLFWLLSAITGAISLGIMIFAPELISVFAPAFTKDPEKYTLTVNLTRIMAPFLMCVSVAALFMGVLNSLKIFFIPSLAPAFYNIMSILSMLGLSGYLLKWGYHPIYSLGIGAMLGGIMQAAVLVPLIIKKGYRPHWPRQFWTEKSTKVVKLIGPGLIGFAATQVNLLIVTILATGTIAGAVSWLNYSFRLFQLPVGILSVSIGNSNMVHFAEAWKKKDVEGAKNTLQSSYFLSFVTVMPALVILYVLSEEIVNLIFERGRFSHEDTLMTAEALRMYAMGLPFYGLYKILVPTFYALDRQKIPVLGSLFSIGFNISFCLLLTPIFGFKILALGTTLSVLVNSVYQGYWLKKDLKLSWNFFFSLRMGKILVASLGSALIVEWLLKVDFFTQPLIIKCTYLSIQIFAICALYGMFLMAMGERSAVNALLSKITSRFRRKLK